MKKHFSLLAVSGLICSPPIISLAVAPSAVFAQSHVRHYPSWLIKDLHLAATVHFPFVGDTYALNWNSDFTSIDLSKVFSATRTLWIGGYTGADKEKSYSFYSGPFNIRSFYEDVKKRNSSTGSVAYPVFIEESGHGSGGVGRLIPAMSMDLGNADFLAFAHDQVITRDNHAGVDQYVVYRVPGISVPSGGFKLWK